MLKKIKINNIWCLLEDWHEKKGGEKKKNIQSTWIILTQWQPPSFRNADPTIIISISQEINCNQMSRLTCKNADLQKSPLWSIIIHSLVHPQNLLHHPHLKELVLFWGLSASTAAIVIKPLSPCNHKANMALILFLLLKHLHPTETDSKVLSVSIVDVGVTPYQNSSFWCSFEFPSYGYWGYGFTLHSSINRSSLFRNFFQNPLYFEMPRSSHGFILPL